MTKQLGLLLIVSGNVELNPRPCKLAQNHQLNSFKISYVINARVNAL